MVGTFCATCTATDFPFIHFGFFPEQFGRKILPTCTATGYSCNDVNVGAMF